VLLDANGDGTLLSLKSNGFPMVIALGPEGGLAQDERDQMIEGGFTMARIGRSILRFETAGIAALAIARAMSEYNDAR
jgi:RsmE family RNA methyltransferase